jgi:signal peptidase I
MSIGGFEKHDTEEISHNEQVGLTSEASTSSVDRSLKRWLREFVEIIVIAGGLFLAVNAASARVRVESISMEPNLYEGQFVVVNRLAYRWANPERGDIIVFYFPNNPAKRYIKRVIGIGGDQISASNGSVFVNGILLDEPYLASRPNYDGEWTVGPGELFVLGDNRNNSNDSKNWGTLELDAVIGKAIFIYWPLGDFGLIPHYDLLNNDGG